MAQQTVHQDIAPSMDTTPAEKITKSKIKKIQTPAESFKSGLALAIAFLAMSAFIYLDPSYLGDSTASVIVGVLLGGIGVAGLSTELNKLGGKDRVLGIDNLGIGLLIGSIWALVYYYLYLLKKGG